MDNLPDLGRQCLTGEEFNHGRRLCQAVEIIEIVARGIGTEPREDLQVAGSGSLLYRRPAEEPVALISCAVFFRVGKAGILEARRGSVWISSGPQRQSYAFIGSSRRSYEARRRHASAVATGCSSLLHVIILTCESCMKPARKGGSGQLGTEPRMRGIMAGKITAPLLTVGSVALPSEDEVFEKSTDRSGRPHSNLER